MIQHIEPQQQTHTYFTFNTEVPRSGNTPRDKAELRLRFELALESFFERFVSQQNQVPDEEAFKL